MSGREGGDPVRAVPRALSRGGTAGPSRILETKVDLGIQVNQEAGGQERMDLFRLEWQIQPVWVKRESSGQSI